VLCSKHPSLTLFEVEYCQARRGCEFFRRTAFSGRRRQKTDNFDALKRASYSFHGLERSTYAMPVAHTTVIGCAGLPALTETRNFKSDASGNDEIKIPLVPTDSRSLPTDTGGKRRTYDHVA
jgi:hypothetical protein